MIEDLGGSVEKCDVGEQEIDGTKIPLPTVILGSINIYLPRLHSFKFQLTFYSLLQNELFKSVAKLNYEPQIV